MTREMFRFFYLLRQQHPDYFLLILTKDDTGQVKREAAEAGILAENIAVTYATRKELPLYLALSTYSIFFIRNTFSKTASSPTKHAELMGMGIPVICNSIGDTGNIITTTASGILINEFEDADLAKGITAAVQVPDWDKAYIRSCAKAIFDLETGAEKYRQLYNKIFDTAVVHA
jgi:glycosyltransferase involved in cell wall biosynthesis